MGRAKEVAKRLERYISESPMQVPSINEIYLKRLNSWILKVLNHNYNSITKQGMNGFKVEELEPLLFKINGKLSDKEKINAIAKVNEDFSEVHFVTTYETSPKLKNLKDKAIIQVFIWRNVKDRSSTLISFRVFDKYIYNSSYKVILSDTKQTLAGHSLWNKLAERSYNKGSSLGVYDKINKEAIMFEDFEEYEGNVADYYASHTSFENYQYIIIKP